jgi:hypothetical protein
MFELGTFVDASLDEVAFSGSRGLDSFYSGGSKLGLNVVLQRLMSLEVSILNLQMLFVSMRFLRIEG